MSIEELHQTNKGKTLIPIHKINVYFFDFDCLLAQFFIVIIQQIKQSN